MRGAATQSSRARIKNAAITEFPVTSLPFRIGIVVDLEIPRHRLVLRSERMKGGNLIVFRQAVPRGVRVAVASSLEHTDGHPRLREASRQCPSPGPGAYDHIIVPWPH